ncbi:hypothetical protein HOK51_06215 [Candidatus Woesearchaeota archaeon]|jgi:hypothetical protein|nr:hypothetical protein [Candidatus Woesearchaeota archaeon]MBT6519420.1 hypothetical protein [Candidatus Woesearchaeota archaeon]MBT7368919.1 hypothetical protein [Candidatus Woesearchaeota archaeon]
MTVQLSSNNYADWYAQLTKLELFADILPILFWVIIALIALMFFQHWYGKKKIEPFSGGKISDFHTLIISTLNKIYAAHHKKGLELKKVYPKLEDIKAATHKIYGINSWIIEPNNSKEIRKGNIGKILVQLDYIWLHEDRIGVAAIIAAWWFNIYLYTLKNESVKPLTYKINISKLGSIRRICNDTLKFAGLGYLINIKSKHNVDFVHSLHKKSQIEQDHRRIAHIEEQDIQAAQEATEKIINLKGKKDIHKIALFRIDHIKDLIKYGKKEVELLKEDLKKRTDLKQKQADLADLEHVIGLLKEIVVWIEKYIHLAHTDKQLEEKLSVKLKQFETVILEATRLFNNLDKILEKE